METSKKTYEDYKYVLQDAGTLSLGAKYSYEEIRHEEDVPFKFKVIAERYLSKDISQDTTLESHVYYMTAEGFPYECLQQLKTKVKCSVLQEKRHLFKGMKKEYTTQVLSLKEFVEKDLSWKKEHGVLIQELMFSKMALMMFSA